MTQYIDKDTVIEEINRQYNQLREHPGTCGSGYILGFRQACWQIIDFCNSLQVKEADLELTLKDISMIRQIMFDYHRQIRNEISIPNDENYCKEILKRFKAQKGE